MSGLIAIALAVAVIGSEAAAADPFGESRGLWISRFDYGDPDGAGAQRIVDQIRNAANAGFTDIYWQVRARSDRYYESTAGLEPRAQAWNSSVDPLGLALQTAKDEGVKLHAWLNTMPLWRDSSVPSDPSHPFFNTNPSFRAFDSSGNVEPLVNGRSGWSNNYVRANHVLPEVQQHINDVVMDITNNYDVDGIHLDYIRWLGPTDPSDGFRADWDFLPHDPTSRALYELETGFVATDQSSIGRERYRDWTRDKVTELVTTIGNSIDAYEQTSGELVELSAAVWNNPTTARNEYLQDYRTWLADDLLDVAIPMVYLRESNRNLLPGFLNDIFNVQTNTEVSIGLGSYLHDGTSGNGGVSETITQMQQVYDDGRADNLTFFAYGSMFDGTLDEQRRAAVQQWYNDLNPGMDPTPGGGLADGSTVLANFDIAGDESTFDRPPNFSGSNIGEGPSTADQTSLEAHLGAGSQLLSLTDDGTPGWFVRHLSGTGNASANVALPTTGSVGFWLKTDDDGLTVQIAVDETGTERGTLQTIIGDGEWRLYEWDFENADDWVPWVGGSNGTIDAATVTLDSIHFFGDGDVEIYLDTVAHNPNGSLLAPTLPGDLNGDGVVDA
ncbi:MAG: family 10 glycosylhydrolase, partial [Planctomycetota bacterium]